MSVRDVGFHGIVCLVQELDQQADWNQVLEVLPYPGTELYSCCKEAV